MRNWCKDKDKPAYWLFMVAIWVVIAVLGLTGEHALTGVAAAVVAAVFAFAALQRGMTQRSTNQSGRTS